MKPRLIHQQAMDYSFKAKNSLEEYNYSDAFEFYKQAADLESQVAEFYFDKPELEPTRSLIIRSAAFLNLKAGLIENAQKFIFFGLLNTKDEVIKSQLNNALELAVSLKKMSSEAASEEFNYINLLRQRSVHYILEPASPVFGNSVSLQMVKDFSEEYLKSLKAYAISRFKKVLEIGNDLEDIFAKEIEKIINPLLTSSGYGSFKFSIANDFLERVGDNKEIVELKSNIVLKYHNEIFINPLTDSDIDGIKKTYSDNEINDIFRPLTKIKSNNSPYKVGYYESENFNKIFTSKIVNKQRKKLLVIKPLSEEDIGELVSSIKHKRSSQSGHITTQTILEKQLKSYEFDIKTHQIEPSENASLLLNEEIVLTVSFNSESGFRFSFDDIQIEHADIDYKAGLKEFYTLLYKRIVALAKKQEKTEQESKEWDVVKKLMNNPEALK